MNNPLIKAMGKNNPINKMMETILFDKIEMNINCF